MVSWAAQLLGAVLPDRHKAFPEAICDVMNPCRSNTNGTAGAKALVLNWRGDGAAGSRALSNLQPIKTSTNALNSCSPELLRWSTAERDFVGALIGQPGEIGKERCDFEWHFLAGQRQRHRAGFG
jgi:hypothetical protein